MPEPSRTDRITVLGLDIGGANLKAASADGRALNVPFALWREPHNLSKRLREIVRFFKPERLAVTMTGELCDCFATKREGVHAILEAVVQAVPKTPCHIWSTLGRFVGREEAHADPLRVAAGNWHALATLVGRDAPSGAAMLIDIGSTTTDIIPLWQGKPIARGRTDPKRLRISELVYTGVRRTPVCSVLGLGIVTDGWDTGLAAEFFATMHDVYLILGDLPEEPLNCDTADGRPATRAAAHARLARQCCDDAEHFSPRTARRVARWARIWQADCIGRAIKAVMQRSPAPPETFFVSGSGDFLAVKALEFMGRPKGSRVLRLARRWSPALSAAACAYALTQLAQEK